jgi:hypothetical protein
MNKAQPVGVANTKVSIMLWPNAQMQLSSSLKSMPAAVQFLITGWSDVSLDESTLPSHLNPSLSGRPCYLTPLAFNNIGELINESDFVINSKGSAGLSIKGHHSKKVGVPTRLPTAEAVTARGASLTRRSSSRGVFGSSHLREIGIS